MTSPSPTAVTLKDGEVVTVRPVTVDDADEMHRVMVTVQATSPHVVLTPDEAPRKEDVPGRLRERLERPGLLFLLAFNADGEAVADCSCTPNPLLKVKHVAGVAMGAVPEYRNRGLGRAMLEMVIAHAKANPAIEMLELTCFGSNAPGISLYESVGFVERGRVIGRYRQLDGTMDDEITMTLDTD